MKMSNPNLVVKQEMACQDAVHNSMPMSPFVTSLSTLMGTGISSGGVLTSFVPTRNNAGMENKMALSGQIQPLLLPKTNIHQNQQALSCSSTTPKKVGLGIGSTNVLMSPSLGSPSHSWNNFMSPNTRKRTRDVESDDFECKQRRTPNRGGSGGGAEKSGTGLRHFSMKVCEKVQQKKVTSYNEVADELVHEFGDKGKSAHGSDGSYDQKNIRRRVYDALNVLMAMNIIKKEKKEIKWIGLPTNSVQECKDLEEQKKERLERIKQKQQQLKELIVQQITYKNLVDRNEKSRKKFGPSQANACIHLPFIIVNTSKKTVIECSISPDKSEYLFNFDEAFEIHDDIEVLKRMGLSYGLEKGMVSQKDLKTVTSMVPKSLESCVAQMANGTFGELDFLETDTSSTATCQQADVDSLSRKPQELFGSTNKSASKKRRMNTSFYDSDNGYEENMAHLE